MSKSRTGFVVSVGVATKSSAYRQQYPGVHSNERPYDDMCPTNLVDDQLSPQGEERGRGYEGRRKALMIWWCGILGGDASVDDIRFAPPLGPLLGIEPGSPA